MDLGVIMNKYSYSYPTYAKVIHFGIAAFGIAAFLTGELADDGNQSLGYLLHAYLGLSLAAFVLVRVLAGFTVSESLSFRGWAPFSRRQRSLAFEDFRTLLKLGIPERDRHQGLAGLVQALGLIIFAWMALSGTALYVLGGGIESEAFEFIEEVHEVGESLIPLYLALHLGAVALHALGRYPIWKKILPFK